MQRHAATLDDPEQTVHVDGINAAASQALMRERQQAPQDKFGRGYLAHPRTAVAPRLG